MTVAASARVVVRCGKKRLFLRAADKAEGRHARDAVSRPDGNGRRVGKAQLSGVERLAALLHKAVGNDAHLLARGAWGKEAILIPVRFPGPAFLYHWPPFTSEKPAALSGRLSPTARQHRNEHGAVQASIRFIRKVSHAFKKIQRTARSMLSKYQEFVGVAKEMAGLAQIEACTSGHIPPLQTRDSANSGKNSKPEEG